MPWKFRKIFGSGPFRWTWTKTGVGVNWGIPGLRFGVSPSGQHYISFGIPGTGLYFIKYFRGRSEKLSVSIPNQSAEAASAEKRMTGGENRKALFQRDMSSNSGLNQKKDSGD